MFALFFDLTKSILAFFTLTTCRKGSGLQFEEVWDTNKKRDDYILIILSLKD